MASKMVSSIKSRGREVTVRTGELISESITTLSKAVSIRGRFTKALKVLSLTFL